MNLWRVRVLVVLLALRAVLQLLPADVADAERHALQTALLFVPETARVLAMAGVLVAVVIYVRVAIRVVQMLARLRAPAIVHIVARMRVLAPVDMEPVVIIVHLHVVQLVVMIAPHVRGLVLVDARIRVRAVEALALTIVRGALAAVLVVVLVLDAPRVPALALAAMDVVTNALLRASSLAPDVPGAVPAVHRVVQAVNPLVVTLVPERAVMAALTHAVRVALPVQRIVLQIAERLARAHATEA